jgi:YcxB-like protein
MAEGDARLTLTWTLTEADIACLASFALGRVKVLRIAQYWFVGCALFSIPFCSWVLATSGDPSSLIPIPLSFLMPLFLSVLVPWLARRASYRAFRNNPAAQQPITATFSAHGITSNSVISRGDLEWEGIIEVFETKTDFFFYQSTQIVFPVPKAAMASLENRRRLRRIVTDAVGDRAKLQPIMSRG